MILPILRIHDVLLTSIHRHLVDEEALQFQGELLDTVHRWEARGVVIDLSAMRVIDSFMSRILGDLGSSCRFLGARPIFCGIQPEVAVTLIEMGRDLRGVETARDLEHALHVFNLRVMDGQAPPTGRSTDDGTP